MPSVDVNKTDNKKPRCMAGLACGRAGIHSLDCTFSQTVEGISIVTFSYCFHHNAAMGVCCASGAHALVGVLRR